MFYAVSGDISKILEDTSLYEKYYNDISEYRKNKVKVLKNFSDKCRCVGAGVLLDECLSKYGLKEKEVRFSTNENGKPVLKDFKNIYFNISHSKNRVFCVISDFNVGCDVEYIRKNLQNEKRISNRFFTESEKKFYQIWTLKESYIKFTGFGMKCPFDSFSVIDQRGELQEGYGCSFWVSGLEFMKYMDLDDPEYVYALCLARETIICGTKINIDRIKL